MIRSARNADGRAVNARYEKLPPELKAEISEERFSKFSTKFQWAIMKEFEVEGDYMAYESLRMEVRRRVSEDTYGIMPDYVKDRLASNETLIEAQIVALSKLPWSDLGKEKEEISVPEAQAILDRSHLGLEKIKNRVLRYIACQKRIGSSYGTVLLFCGPPGVGKTSIARSIAQAMHRKLVKIPLAGVTEAAVLKGTSPIYANSRPGRIIDAIINSKSFSPLILLDEVDKIAQGFRGANPQFALLDILDSDRSEYIDDCLGIPLDLRNVIFIATANDLENISPILLDRFDLIQLPGYGPEEKEAIARGYLMRDLYAYYGIGPEELSLSDEVLAYMVEKLSAREFGVRQLNNSLRQIFEETVYCKEMGRDFRHVWEKEDVDRFFDL